MAGALTELQPANAAPTFANDRSIPGTFNGEVRSNNGTYTVTHTIAAGPFASVRP